MNRLFLLVWAGATLVSGQQPPITNADVRQVSAAGGFETAIRTAAGPGGGPAWIGYAVPVIPGERNSCCWNQDGRGCGLEGDRRSATGSQPGPVLLEGPTHIAILLRFENGTPGKLRAFALDCPLDAGGLPFFWLTGVNPAQSVAMLSALATRNGGEGERKRFGDAAVYAVAMHAAPEAQAALLRFVDPSQPESIRKQALFWLANLRGKEGYEAVRKVLRGDASERVREHAIFALTQSREPEALREIIRAAKEDKTPRIRSKALFWLSQKASRQVADTITEAAANDPDTEVKKKAVFALSRLPKDEGIPRLIQVARSHTNPAVRKQAIFWLGQSRDRRALEFLEQALLK